MKFKASFCDPLNPKIIELGEIGKDKIIELFSKIAWGDFLEKMKDKTDEELFFSPSLEIHCTDTENGLSISAVGEPENFEFYIFYKRPKTLSKLFGLSKTIQNDFLTEIDGQTEDDVTDCLNALIRNDLAFLEEKIK
ncbi:MAG: hypothetical protein ACXVP0_11860 [Bacteroidia bacterium]